MTHIFNLFVCYSVRSNLVENNRGLRFTVQSRGYSSSNSSCWASHTSYRQHLWSCWHDCWIWSSSDPGRQRRLKQQHKLTHSESEKQPQEVRKGKILNRYLSTIICLFRLLNHLNFRRNFNWKVREIVSVKALIYWKCPFDAYIELSARFIEDVG